MKRSKKRDKLREIMKDKFEEYKEQHRNKYAAKALKQGIPKKPIKAESGPIVEFVKPSEIDDDEISAMSEREMFKKCFFGKG